MYLTAVSVGLAWNLKKFSANEITKGKILMQQKRLDAHKTRLRWPSAIRKLPAMSPEDVRAARDTGRFLIVVDGLVHDVTKFIPEHPGGESVPSLGPSYL